jgi:hypothetical protein
MLFTGYSQKEAAEIYREALGVLGVNKTHITAMFLAVRYWPWTIKVIQPEEK